MTALWSPRVAWRTPPAKTGGPAGARPALSDDWTRALLVLAFAVAGIIALFFADFAAMVRIWWDSSTFNHCLLLVPIIGWLIAQRAPVLRTLTPTGWWPGLLVALAAGVLWLAGELAGLALFRQAGIVAMLVAAVITILGPQVARALTFPLFYMAFLVPFGEELVPALQTLTAAMSMQLLGWAGIPAHIDGIFITTPNGYFEVAEACSGVKFLIAMAAYAVLVAHLCFRSTHRRVLFLAFALVVPVIANGLRAFGTIWIADRVDLSFAASFDHVFYGWIFFGLVIVLVMVAAYPFFDRPADDMPPAPRIAGWMMRGRTSPAIALAALAVVLVAPPVWARATAPLPGDSVATPRFAVPSGWRVATASPVPSWSPHFAGADVVAQTRLEPVGGGQAVDLALAAFATQAEGRELVGFGQGAVPPGGPWTWSAGLPAIDGMVAERMVALGPVHRIAATHRRIGGTPTHGGVHAKWLTLRGRLPGGDPLAVAVVVSAVDDGAGRGRAAIERLLRDAGGIDPLADALEAQLRVPGPAD